MMNSISKSGHQSLWHDKRAIALLMAASLTTMANATISPALAGLQSLFAAHPHGQMLVPLLVSAPSLTVILSAPVCGILADRLGRRGMLLAGVLLFVLSGPAGFFLSDLEMIFGSRLVLGIAVAMIMTSQTALVGDYYSGSNRTTLTGLQISARNFGGFIFITLAGWLAATSPKYPFALYGLAAFFLPFMWFAIEEPKITRQNLSSIGEQRVDSPVNWKFLIILLTLLQVITNMVFFIIPTQLPFYLDALLYESSVMTGTTLGALTLAGGIMALAYGRIKEKLGFSGTYAVAYGLMSFGFALLPHASSLLILLVGAIAIGTGFALAMPNFAALALQLAPQHFRGIVGGSLTMAVFLGQFVSPLISTPTISTLGFQVFFYCAALLLAILTALAGATHLIKESQIRHGTC